MMNQINKRLEISLVTKYNLKMGKTVIRPNDKRNEVHSETKFVLKRITLIEK